MKKLFYILFTIFLGISFLIPFSYSSVQAATTNCSFTRSLALGSSGADVSCLQQYLNANGFTITATGYFGAITKSAVIKWQNAHGISPASGYFGKTSQAKYSELILLNQSVLNQSQSQTSISTPVIGISNTQPLLVNSPLLLCSVPTTGPIANIDLSKNINSALSNLVAKGRPVDPITQGVQPGDTGWQAFLDQMRALYLSANTISSRQLATSYGNAGLAYDNAVNYLNISVQACNSSDYVSAKAMYESAQGQISLMGDQINLGLSFSPEIVKAAVTLFIYKSMTLPVSVVSSSVLPFVTPVINGITTYDANPEPAKF